MSGFTSGFALPQSDPNADAADNESAAQEARWDAVVGQAKPAGATPEDDAAANARLASLAQGDQARAAGIYVAGLGTKAVEGLTDLGSRFGDAIPFLKAGAKTPSFAALANPATLAKSLLGGITGKLFGKAGLISGKQQAASIAATVPTSTAAQFNQIVKNSNRDEDKTHLVTLTDLDGYVIPFVVMPEIVENRSVDYEAVAPAQFPGAFQKYKGTQSVQWTVNATFIARTSEEATTNLRYLNLLRSWTMPFFGENTAFVHPDRIGAPPHVLKFKGLRKGIIGEVPVVITSLQWNWPKDVDYIPARSPDGLDDNIPFPTVIQVAIQLIESFSTTQFNQFDLDSYRLGNFKQAYNSKVNGPTNNNGTTTAPPASAEAQAPPAGAFRGLRSDVDSARRVVVGLGASVGGGRGTINPPNVVPALSEIKSAASKFKSGGGGNFGGGGAGGSF